MDQQCSGSPNKSTNGSPNDGRSDPTTTTTDLVKKEDFNHQQFFFTNKQYIKIKLMQNETNHWSIFSGEDNRLIKL